MEPIHTKIRLEGARATQSRVVEVSARVNMDGPYLCLPAAVVATLDLPAQGSRIIITVDNDAREYPYVGPVTVQCGEHVCFTGAVEFGDEVVLGTIALHALGLTVDQTQGRLVTAPVPSAPWLRD